jgi:malate-CoA ligase subunit beta
VAFGRIDVQLPVVVRLAGTHVEEGRRILAGSGLPIVTADTLADAAATAVAATISTEAAVARIDAEAAMAADGPGS